MRHRSLGIDMRHITAILLLAFSCAIPVRAQDIIPIATVTASSSDTNLPANAIDGDLATRWSAQGDGEWLQIELSDRIIISGVQIAFFKGDQRVSSFDLDVSVDGATWQTVYIGQSSGQSAGFELFNFDPLSARYVRYIGHGNSVNNWNSLTEIQVLGHQESPPPGPPALKSVTFRWTDERNLQVDGYRIYYGVQSGVYVARIQVGDVREAVAEIPVLADTMHFAATAFLADIESPYSEDVAADMSQIKPDVTLIAPRLDEVIPQ